MSVKIEKKDGKTFITLENGHAKALEKITEDYEIIDEEKAIGFILSILRDAEGSPIETKDGSFLPSDSIKKIVTPSHDDTKSE